ncbi:T-cell antigen CD7, partial [Apaloderma vittatum]
LLKTHVQRETVLYVSSQNASTVCSAFADRLEYSEEEKKIVITLRNLQKNDSGVYVCAVVMKNSSFLSANGRGTMMLIKEVEQSECVYSSWGIYALVIVVALLFLELTCCALYNAKMKKNFQKRNPNNTIYEDMSYGSRRNTLNR